MRIEYEQTCPIKCTNNGVSIEAEVLNFQDGKVLTVSLNRSARLTLNFNGQVYVGRSSNMEFTTDGPKSVTYRDGRR